MKNRIACICRTAAHDQRGSMAIETAFVAPVLLLLALGGFEVSQMVARQTELQSAAAEAAAVVRATPPENWQERRTIRQIIQTSTGLDNEHVSVQEVFRCGTQTAYTDDGDACGSNPKSTFIRIIISDNYTPIWANYGIGSGFEYNVQRTVQIG